MPIKPELRYFYPIDWPQISHWVRFVRAKGHCQVCGRPHGETVQHLGDGRWWDETEQTWRDGLWSSAGIWVGVAGTYHWQTGVAA